MNRFDHTKSKGVAQNSFFEKTSSFDTIQDYLVQMPDNKVVRSGWHF